MQKSPRITPVFKYMSLAWLLLAALLSSCAPLVREGQTAIYQQDTGIQAGKSAGQTFLSSYAGLSEIRVFLAADSPGDGRVILRLWDAPGGAGELASSSLALAEIGDGRYTPFRFDPQPGSFLKTYYFSLEVVGSGALRAGTGGPSDYLNGSLYQNGQPAEGQLAFQLAYDPLGLAGGLLAEAAGWLGWLLLLGLFFVLPGYGLLRAWSPSLTRLGALSLAGGLGIAFYPLLMLWGQLFHLRLGAGYAWGAAGLGALVWVVRRLRGGHVWRKISLNGWWRSPHLAADLFFVFVVALVVFTRLWAFRAAAAPLWGDSVQHSVIAQLILDHGGLFNSWEPYAPYHSLTVQYGFSAGAAVWAWVSGQAIPHGVVVFGQLLNILAVIAWYPLGCRLAKGNRWAGAVAVLVAGLLSGVPGFYSNWGRYAQLAGQTALPAALWLTWDLLERKRLDKPGVLLLGACLAGMLLCYYRMAFYYASFTLVLLLVYWPAAMTGWKARRRALGSLTAAAGVLLILLVPWIIQVRGSSLAGSVLIGIESGSTLQSLRSDYANWSYVTSLVALPLLVLAGLGGALGVVRRHWLVAGLLLWTALLAAVRAATLIHFPGANMMMSTAVMYFLYAPVGLSAGWLCGEILGWLQARWRLGWAVGVVLLAAAALLGARMQSRMMAPNPYSLVAWPDLNAAGWIRKNTPVDALFLVEGFRIYGGSTAVGSDAGWWLPLLTGRANTMPPQYALVEQPASPGYTQRVVDLITLLEDQPPAGPQGLAALCSWGVTHVYIGQQRGLASFERLQLFAPQDFDSSPAFQLVYAQDRVRIYRLDTHLCP